MLVAEDGPAIEYGGLRVANARARPMPHASPRGAHVRENPWIMGQPTVGSLRAELAAGLIAQLESAERRQPSDFYSRGPMGLFPGVGQRSSRIPARISALDAALTYLQPSITNNVALEAISSNSHWIGGCFGPLDPVWLCFPELLFLFSVSMFWELLLWFGVDAWDHVLRMLILALSMCKCFMLTTVPTKLNQILRVEQNALD